MSLTVFEQIVGAVADAEGTNASDLDVTLENWVDTDAIEQLASHDSNQWMLEFYLPKHTVTVTGQDVILVDGAEERDIS